jgi:hypothetical protein
MLAGAHDVDLSAVGPAEIGRRIAQALSQEPFVPPGA